MAKSEHKYIGGILHQKCTRCNEWKPADDDHYSPSKQGRIGFKPYCRACLREISQNYHASKYESQRVRKRRYSPIPKDSPPIKKIPLPDEFKKFYQHITRGLDGQTRYKAYLITCKTTNQHYVGITERKLESRWMQHLREVNKQRGYLLHQEISQYGIWDFDFKYVASAKSRSDLHELEKQLIRQYDTVENGFNQTRGGATGETVGNPVTVEGITFISLNAAARHYGVEEYSVHQRMNRYGFSLEEAIGIEYKQKQPRKTNPYEVDGQTFPNFADACRQYGLEDSAVRSRLKIGWTIRQAFGIDMPPQKGRNSYGKSVTIKGAVFRTFADAAREYGLKACTLTSRFRKGWTPEQAVGLEPSPKPITTRKWTFGKAFGLEPQPKKRTGSNRKSIIVEGVVYNSHKEAAEKYGLDHRKIFQRVNKLGWTIEQAFGLEPQAKKRTAPNRKSITVEGVVYNSHKEAAEKYGLDHRKIFKRIYKFGWTIEQAFGLEPPSEKPSNSSKKVMIKSVTYESITAACSAFEIAISTVQRRVKSGWTIEDAVTVPSRKSKK